jgi:hypothetical protein
MPKPVKKAAAKKKAAPKRPSADPMLRARQLQAEHMERLETSAKPWDAAPAAAPTFKEQLSAHMSELGKKGGKASGAARMTNIAEGDRRRIASLAARERWRRVAEAKKKR